MSIQPPKGSQDTHAFAGYQPRDEFEARTIAVFDELVYGLAALRAEVASLRAQVAANTESTVRNSNRILEAVNRMGEVTHEAGIMLEIVQIARRDLEEAAKVIRMARDEIHAMTRESRNERPTDPSLVRPPKT